MSRTPAAALAGLKVKFPEWRVERRELEDGPPVYVAVHRADGYRVTACTPGGLDHALYATRAEGGNESR